jgi:hypothetical protein
VNFIPKVIAYVAGFVRLRFHSFTTALAVEQAGSMGFKGGFVMIDQARMDFIAGILKNMKLMD